MKVLLAFSYVCVWVKFCFLVWKDIFRIVSKFQKLNGERKLRFCSSSKLCFQLCTAGGRQRSITFFVSSYVDAWTYSQSVRQVGIAGVPADEVMKKTKIKEDNWIPQWEEEFTFPLQVPELALLRVEVHEYDMSEKDDFAGQTCLPVAELKQGIRAVPLYNRKGEKYNSVRLLMRFEFI